MTTTATNHDDQGHNLVKFVPRCQMTNCSEETVHLAGNCAVVAVMVMVCGHDGIPCGRYGQGLRPSWYRPLSHLHLYRAAAHQSQYQELLLARFRSASVDPTHRR